MLEPKGNALVLTVKVVPNASRTQIVGPMGKPAVALKVKVAQPPEDGRANRAVMEVLAEALGVPLGQITLLTGQTRPQKTFHIVGVTVEQAMERLVSAP